MEIFKKAILVVFGTTVYLAIADLLINESALTVVAVIIANIICLLLLYIKPFVKDVRERVEIIKERQKPVQFVYFRVEDDEIEVTSLPPSNLLISKLTERGKLVYLGLL